MQLSHCFGSQREACYLLILLSVEGAGVLSRSNVIGLRELLSAQLSRQSRCVHLSRRIFLGLV